MKPHSWKLLTMGREEVDTFLGGPADICISIRSPGTAFPPRLSPNFRAVLVLEFHDCGAWTRRGGSLPQEAVDQGAVDMTDDQADQVVAFVAQHPDARRVVVHCEAGISRSVAVAVGLSATFQGTPEWRPSWHLLSRRLMERDRGPDGLADLCNPVVARRVVRAYDRAGGRTEPTGEQLARMHDP